MRSSTIQKLITAVKSTYGPVTPYGSETGEEHGAGFRIAGIPAIFSVHTQEGELPPDEYDVQIESFPPGDYLYISITMLQGILDLIAKLQRPEEEWPRME